MQRWGGRQRPRKWFKRTGAAENRSGSKKERERERACCLNFNHCILLLVFLLLRQQPAASLLALLGISLPSIGACEIYFPEHRRSSLVVPVGYASRRSRLLLDLAIRVSCLFA